jgi:hypothetical protein
MRATALWANEVPPGAAGCHIKNRPQDVSRGRLFSPVARDQPLAIVLMRIGLSTNKAMTAAMILRIAAT